MKRRGQIDVGRSRPMPAHDTTHEVIPDPLADERREADDEVTVVRVAKERQAPDARNGILAPSPPFDEDRMKPASEGPEAVAVEVEPADLATERVDVLADVLPR